MKFGCRSQSWYIISQKHDMMASQASSRGSSTSRSVRQSTCQTVSVFDAPLGTSWNANSSSRLNDVNTAEARNRLRQASGEFASAWNGPGSSTLRLSRIVGR